MVKEELKVPLKWVLQSLTSNWSIKTFDAMELVADQYDRFLSNLGSKATPGRIASGIAGEANLVYTGDLDRMVIEPHIRKEVERMEEVVTGLDSERTDH